MKPFTTPDFWRAYATLYPAMTQKARKAYRLWQTNPLHPSLRFPRSHALLGHAVLEAPASCASASSGETDAAGAAGQRYAGTAR